MTNVSKTDTHSIGLSPTRDGGIRFILFKKWSREREAIAYVDLSRARAKELLKDVGALLRDQ